LNALEDDQVTSFTGMYTRKNLEIYLSSLQENITDSTRSIALVLSSIDHAITIGYDATNKIWCFIDANTLPVEYISKDEFNVMAEKILFAFEGESMVAFSSSIYIHTADKSLIDNWQASPDFKGINDPNNLEIYNANKDEWLYCAIEDNQSDTLEKLMKNGVNPNIIFADGKTSLTLAVEHNAIKSLEISLNPGANPDLNFSDHTSSPLLLAAILNRSPIANLLLQFKATPNFQNLHGRTPLIESARVGNILDALSNTVKSQIIFHRVFLYPTP
jgi:hypothetical protein